MSISIINSGNELDTVENVAKFFVMNTTQEPAGCKKVAGKCLLCRVPSDDLTRGLCSTDYNRFRSALKALPSHRQDAYEQMLINQGLLLKSQQGKRIPDEEDIFKQKARQFLSGSDSHLPSDDIDEAVRRSDDRKEKARLQRKAASDQIQNESQPRKRKPKKP